MSLLNHGPSRATCAAAAFCWTHAQTDAREHGPPSIARHTCCSFARLLHTIGKSNTHKWWATAAPFCTSSIRHVTYREHRHSNLLFWCKNHQSVQVLHALCALDCSKTSTTLQSLCSGLTRVSEPTLACSCMNATH